MVGGQSRGEKSQQTALLSTTVRLGNGREGANVVYGSLYCCCPQSTAATLPLVQSSNTNTSHMTHHNTLWHLFIPSPTHSKVESLLSDRLANYQLVPLSFTRYTLQTVPTVPSLDTLFDVAFIFFLSFFHHTPFRVHHERPHP